jgi:hypothetical protein
LATCELQVIMQLVVVEVSGVARPVRGGVTFGMEVGAAGGAGLRLLAVKDITPLEGWLADRVGRKIPLMISILWYSLSNFAAGFSPTFTYLFLFRALLGIGMGGEWPAGAALAMETWPVRSRGFMGGVLQGCPPSGLCSLANADPIRRAYCHRDSLKVRRATYRRLSGETNPEYHSWTSWFGCGAWALASMKLPSARMRLTRRFFRA